MFKNITLKHKIILFTTVSLLVIFVFSQFMSNTINTIDDSINLYKNKAVKGKLIILSIEKDLNYISRCSRDIMLGNDYLENISKIDNSIILIKQNFEALEKTLTNTQNYQKKLLIIRKAKDTTIQFINGVKIKMKQLEHSSDIEKTNAYKDYKKDLTPLAIQSRKYFIKIRLIKDKGFQNISKDLNTSIVNERKFIVFSNIFLAILAIIIMILVYYVVNKQLKTQDNLNILHSLLTKYVIFSKTDLNGNITEASDAFCAISRYSRDELIGKPHNIIRHPDMPSSIFKNVWDTIQAGDVWEGEVKNLKKDGGQYWVNSHISPEYDENNNITGYLAIRYDISAKKDFEQQNIQLMQSEKMATLGEMIGNIAHQWRQPLSAISSTASAIQVESELEILENKEIPQRMKNIVEKTHFLSETINTFRDFIKGEKIYKKIVLQDEVSQAINIASAILQDNHIILNNNIDYKNKINITMVSGELPQVIINILNNAKDVLIEKDIINPTIELNIIQKDKRVIITIEDNACGIPSDIISKIFEPYFTTKHQSQGTGLGLHMSYQIITVSLKGKLYVENTQKGAKFFIELPLS